MQHDLTEAEDQEAARADVESACGMTGDGDGAVFAESECTPGIAACDGATGTLESTGEAVPIKVVWYAEACDLFVDNSGTCTSLGGTFSGTACTPP